MTQAGSVDHAAADRENILDRAANFSADDIIGIIRPEAGFCDQRVEPLPKRFTFARQGQGCWQALRDFMGKGRAGQDCEIIIRSHDLGNLA